MGRSQSEPSLWRRATAPLRALPDYLVIGAMKSGTTWLHLLLAHHPQILPASRKEVHYFDNHLQRGPLWYRAHFHTRFKLWRGSRRRRARMLTGEATPRYLAMPHIPKEAARLVPEARVLILLRNPVDRVWSHYWHRVREGVEDLDFEPALEQDGRHDGYLARSRYAEQVARWMDFFPRRNILILGSEETFAHPREGCARVLDFLGLQPHPKPDFAPVNTADYEPIPEHVRKRLAEYFEPHNRALYELVGRDFGWE